MPTLENIYCSNSYRHEALTLAKCWFPRERNTCYFGNILVDLLQFIGKHWFTIGGVKEINYPNSNGYDPRFWRNCDHHEAILYECHPCKHAIHAKKRDMLGSAPNVLKHFSIVLKHSGLGGRLGGRSFPGRPKQTKKSLY